MDQVQVIRHKVLVEGKSIRQTAREMRVSRNTVRRYLKQSEPRRTEKHPRPRPALERVEARLKELLEDWSTRTTPKQRITAARLHRQLLEEGSQVGASTVKEYFREWRRQRQEVFIPLVHRPGEAQVDFFDVTVEIGGERRKAWKFLMRLMYSGRDFVWLYDRAEQISLLDGHVRAFEHFGGYPSKIVYDNLKPVVKKMLADGRELTDGFLRFTSHYPFEPLFARRGRGNDKGGVEGRGKNLRLQHLVPIPRGSSLEEISRETLAAVDKAMDERHDRAGRSVTERFAEEASLLQALPSASFDVRRVEPVSVGPGALVRVDGAEYSVPSEWAQLDAMAYVGVDSIEIICRGRSTRHDRKPKKTRTVNYTHYLPELAQKPQAVRQVAPELVLELGAPFDRLWTLLASAHGERKAARVLAAVVGAIVEYGRDEVARALSATLTAGKTDLIALFALLKQESDFPRVDVPPALAGYEVQKGSSKDYDHLLTN